MIQKSMLYMVAMLTAIAGSLQAIELTNDITHEIPVMEKVSSDEHMDYDAFEVLTDTAQYRCADWDNVVGIARHISLKEAKQIAASNPEITFFFYTKGGQMVLENEDGSYRLFRHGDTVFFSGDHWLGSAPGLADAYICR